MNSDLEQFSEERLKEIIEFRVKPTPLDGVLLARIAMEAKQAKPVYQIEDADGWQDCEKDEYHSLIKSQGIHPMYCRVLYTTPQPAHTEQGIPDGFTEIQLIKAITWINRVRRENQNMKEARTCAELILRFLPAAPKPESE